MSCCFGLLKEVKIGGSFEEGVREGRQTVMHSEFNELGRRKLAYSVALDLKCAAVQFCVCDMRRVALCERW